MSSYNEYMTNKNPIIRTRLKSLDDPCFRNTPLTRRWYINKEMKERMGNGIQYKFKKLEDGHIHSNAYTHMSNDGYIYHESWFVDSEPILELDEEDFLL